jgi:NhaP-type Na+/H+ or K+/H+ antiporter
MKWELAMIAATVLAVAAVSRRLTGTPVTPAMVFVVVGVLVGPLVFDEVTAAPTGEGVRTLAEATLAVVLFADASRIKPRVLRREYAVPVRLLGVGLPLTIAMGAVLAAVMFDQLNVTEAIVLAILLAPTDAALGEAVVRRRDCRHGSVRDSTSRAGSTTGSASRCCSSPSPRRTSRTRPRAATTQSASWPSRSATASSEAWRRG